MKKPKKVAVITADIIGSREIVDRGELQRKIKKVLLEINQNHSEEILAEFMITLGDEFQGLVKDIGKSYDVFSEIQTKLHPVGVHCGIGIGDIETAISDKVTEMDGTAFHRSRKALVLAKESKAEVLINSGDPSFDETINIIVDLLSTIKKRWTKRQREVIKYYRSKENLKLEDVARVFDVTKQSISQILDAANWRLVTRTEEKIRNLLSNVK